MTNVQSDVRPVASRKVDRRPWYRLAGVVAALAAAYVAFAIYYQSVGLLMHNASRLTRGVLCNWIDNRHLVVFSGTSARCYDYATREGTPYASTYDAMRIKLLAAGVNE